MDRRDGEGLERGEWGMVKGAAVRLCGCAAVRVQSEPSSTRRTSITSREPPRARPRTASRQAERRTRRQRRRASACRVRLSPRLRSDALLTSLQTAPSTHNTRVVVTLVTLVTLVAVGQSYISRVRPPHNTCGANRGSLFQPKSGGCGGDHVDSVGGCGPLKESLS